jgi:hypothetical protein
MEGVGEDGGIFIGSCFDLVAGNLGVSKTGDPLIAAGKVDGLALQYSSQGLDQRVGLACSCPRFEFEVPAPIECGKEGH